MTIQVRPGDLDCDAVAFPAMLTYTRRRLDADQVEDAVSECVSRAVAGAARIPSDGCSPEAWVFGILRHVVIDFQRRSYRNRLLRMRIPRPVLESGDLGSENLVGGEEQEAVRKAFAKLSARDQEILELRVVAGLRADEVSKLLGMRSATVRNSQYRALRRLREHLKWDEGTES